MFPSIGCKTWSPKDKLKDDGLGLRIYTSWEAPE